MHFCTDELWALLAALPWVPYCWYKVCLWCGRAAPRPSNHTCSRHDVVGSTHQEQP